MPCTTDGLVVVVAVYYHFYPPTVVAKLHILIYRTYILLLI